MRAEITNPHDQATIDVDDKEAACLAVCLIGEGKYGIENVMPLFFFGGRDEWFKEQFGHDAFVGIETVGWERIAKALRSARLEHKRSSITDFIGYAHKLAKKLENKKPPAGGEGEGAGDRGNAPVEGV